jgi:hypothetical protein
MDELQKELEQAKLQVERAGELLTAALKRRNNAKKAGVNRKELEESIVAAKNQFTAAEVRLRTLYEAKGDWVPLSQVGHALAVPAPIAVP